MTNLEIADTFERMARVIAFKGGDRFRIIAYERAAASLRDVEDLEARATAGKLREIPGIGKDLEEMVIEGLRSGRIRRYEQERKGLSDELIELMSIPGLGPKTLALIHKRLRIENLEDLKRAIDTQALLKLPGFKEKKIENLQRGIELWLGRHQRMPLGIALPLAERLLEEVRKIKVVEQADIAGSVRRRKETIGDLDILIVSKDSPEALRQITRIPSVKRVTALGDTRAAVRIEGGTQVDFRAVEKVSYGAALQYFTGSKEHNVHLRKLARERGWKINEYGVFEGKRRIGGATENEIYKLLGMRIMPPEIREDKGEIEVAIKGKLPKLLELSDLRGDLHVHTDYSDGKSSAEEILEAAEKLGYEYIALTDHSPAARIAHGLDLDRLAEKREFLNRLKRRRRGRKPEILMGTEVDILPDGSLDYPDEVLREFDIVVAAVHMGFKESKERMTMRMLDALGNPHVHVLAHPTARLLGSRDPVKFDFDRILDRAKANNVALELNASFLRLDLNDSMCRSAQSAGVLLSLGSDSHSTAQLSGMRYGVFQARRGWVEPKSVINTWPLAKLLAWLRQRRGIGIRRVG